ncbi:hypothetical protein GDO86_006739 [Hymenochirus boettgeri]|uniref:IRS-type PTB domain-containing protein n=1 Tax=Hymenochirus boettgeri TaxID=247094 RepID=A0A8T2JC01_9PIPI|nr:hypothetical protein GDO86_006739 [Hymenochirus boettgeri]
MEEGLGVLHEGSCSGLARLEIFEGSQPPDSGAMGKHVQRHTFFCIETTQRVYLLASETSEQPGWVRALCSLAFPRDRVPLERQLSHTAKSGLQLQENSLYTHHRESENNCLSLRDRQTGTQLFNWPYPYLRRFGRDKAGRRCTSGEGSFEFEDSSWRTPTSPKESTRSVAGQSTYMTAQKTPLNPVYDEPEGIRADAWKLQGTDGHEFGMNYPYLPGLDDYAVPRGKFIKQTTA